ncbi:MAG: FRG domain-containing protein [Eubacteriales bacterium]|jgi:hypothetical protein
MDIFDEASRAEDVVERLNVLARHGDYVFRGYGKQDELFPNIIRGQVNYVVIEDKLLKDFEKYGSSYFHATTPIDFMSYAQHFGIPTRLLDFTYNPFIALSFSLYTPKSNAKYKNNMDKDFYYVRYASLSENLLKYSIQLKDDIHNSKFTRTDSLAIKACQCIDSVTDLFGNNFLDRDINSLSGFLEGGIENAIEEQEKIRRRVILFIDPNQSNQRIIMQQGLFMFPYVLEKEEHINILNEYSKFIMVHKNLRNDLIQYLDVLGYNTFRLMPDLSSICEAVKRRNIDARTSLVKKY